MKELTRLNISRIASITRNFLGIATPVELNALTQAIREKLNGQRIAVENTELEHDAEISLNVTECNFVIRYKKNIPETAQKFAILSELGHLIMTLADTQRETHG